VPPKVDLMNALMFDPNLLKDKGPDFVRKGFKLVGMCVKYFLEYSTIFSDYCKIISVVKRHQIHLIHFNAYGDQYLLFAVIAFFFKIPVVYHVRGRVRPALKVRFFARFAFFIYVSQYVEQFFYLMGRPPGATMSFIMVEMLMNSKILQFKRTFLRSEKLQQSPQAIK